jgi:hypothetical protein
MHECRSATRDCRRTPEALGATTVSGPGIRECLAVEERGTGLVTTNSVPRQPIRNPFVVFYFPVEIILLARSRLAFPTSSFPISHLAK